MNRIDEIQKEYDRARSIRFDNEKHFDLESVGYLLSSLEIAEKALTRIHLASPSIATSAFETKEDREEYADSIIEVMEALQQIRE